MYQTRHPDELGRLFLEHANAGDVEGLVALYEPTAVLSTGSIAVARGADEIRSFYAALMAQGIKFVPGRQQPALICDDLALTATRLADGTVTVEIARRQPDGSWLWVADQPSLLAFWDGP